MQYLRYTALAVLASLAFAGTADAKRKPWLTIARAKQTVAALGAQSVREGYSTASSTGSCQRINRVVVNCHLLLTNWSGGATDNTGDGWDADLILTAHLHRGRVDIDF